VSQLEKGRSLYNLSPNRPHLFNAARVTRKSENLGLILDILPEEKVSG